MPLKTKIGLMILTLATAHPGAAAQDVRFPETPAGRRAAEYIRYFNTGSESDMASFFAESIGAEARQRRSDAERLRFYRQMRDRMGRLTVRSVAPSSPTAISFQAEGDKGGWFEFDFRLEALPPYLIDQIRIERIEPPAAGPDAVPGAETGDAELRRRLEEFTARVESFGFAGGVMVARGGTVLMEKGFGMADRAGVVPCTNQTAFDIGSNTKDFTKVAILQLAVRGRIGLDDPIGRYFKDAPPDKAGITIAQLLDHTAGLKLYSGPDEEVLTREDFLKRILETPLIAQPGTEQNYSNPGYSLLAAIIEAVTGGSYESYLAENIFKPAGMTQTGYALPAWKPGQIARSYAAGQDRGSTFDYPHAPDGPYWNLRGNGGTLATMGDMYRFHLALEGNAILPAESKALLFPPDKPVTLVGGNGIHYFVYYREPAARLAVFVASIDAGLRAMDLERELVRLTKGREVEMPPAVVKLGGAVLERYAGTYRLASGASIIASVEGDALALSGDGQAAMDLLAGNGPDTAARSAELNARTQAIVDAGDKGDYGPLAKALGPGAPLSLDELRKREDAVAKQRTDAFGAFREVKVLGTIVRTSGRGPRTTMSPAEATTVVRYNYGRGTAYTQFMWGAEGLVGIRPGPAPATFAFRPQSDTAFASYDLSAGRTTGISFRIDAAGRVASLRFDSNGVEARRAD